MSASGWDESPKVYMAAGSRKYHLEPHCHYLNGVCGRAVETTTKYAEFRGYRVCKVCAGTKNN